MEYVEARKAVTRAIPTERGESDGTSEWRAAPAGARRRAPRLGLAHASHARPRAKALVARRRLGRVPWRVGARVWALDGVALVDDGARDVGEAEVAVAG